MAKNKRSKQSDTRTKSSQKKGKKSDDDDDDIDAGEAKAYIKSQNRGGAACFALPTGVEKFNPKAKTYHLDVIPYRISDPNHPSGKPVGRLWYERTYWLHYNVGDKPITCLKSVGKKCPACERYRHLKKSKEEEDNERADEIKPKERQMFNVIDLDNEDDGVMLFEISPYNFTTTLEEEIKEAPEDYAAFASLKKGYTLKVRFKQSSMGSGNYIEASRIDFEEREPYDKSILKEATDLDQILIVPTADEVRKMLNEEDEGAVEEESRDEDEEEDKGSRGRGRKGGRKERSVDDDEGEDEGDDAGEDEDTGEDEGEDELYTWPELEEMTKDDLKEVISEESLEVKPSKKVNKMREEVWDALIEAGLAEEEDKASEEEEEAEEEPGQEEEEKPAKSGKSEKSGKSGKSGTGKTGKSGKSGTGKTGKSGKSGKSGKGGNSKSKCPAGGEFGKDCDEFDECGNCDLWIDCKEAQED